MALELTLGKVVLNDRKALVLTDSTPQIDENGAPAGWGVDFDFADYVQAGSRVASLMVTKDHYDGTTETVLFSLTALGFFEGVTLQSELVYNLVSIDGVMNLVSTSAYDEDAVEELPDGYYTFIYALEDPVVSSSSIFVFDKKAESILEEKAENLDCKIFSSNSTDLVQLIDIVILEAMIFVVDRSEALAKKQIILDMLKIINNEEYEYYRE